MTTDPSPQTSSTSSGSKRGKAKLIVFLGLALVIVIASSTGWLGFAWAHLRSKILPKDEGLLEYVPGTTSALVIVDPHQFDPKALGAENGAARTYLNRTRDDIKKAAGIDLLFDVDKLVFTPTLVVARGRFSHKQLVDRLGQHGYVEAEYKGQKYVVRSGEDAVAVTGSILLYGSEDSIQRGIDAEANSTSLKERDEVTARLAEMGWNHPVLATAQLTEAKPSLRDILAGSTGPRAVTVGISMNNGLTIVSTIEAASSAAAEELKKLLEEKRKADPATLKTILGDDVGQLAFDIANRSTITLQPNSEKISIQVDISPEELDKLAKATDKASKAFSEAYKNIRLFQLLMPQ